jgi:hypothetical protein
VAPLYEKMRGEAVRQVREILGIETDPDDWWFHELSWPNPADRWHLDIVIDGLNVWLNANYRLFVEHGPGDGRLRTAEDFEAAAYTRDIPLRAAQLHAEIYARELRYEAVTGTDNPLMAYRKRYQPVQVRRRSLRWPVIPPGHDRVEGKPVARRSAYRRRVVFAYRRLRAAGPTLDGLSV